MDLYSNATNATSSRAVRRAVGLMFFLVFMVLAAVLLSPAGAGAADGATSSASKKSVKVKAKFLTRSQSSLSSGRAKVQLKLKTGKKGPKKAKVKLQVQVKQPWSKWTTGGRQKVTIKAGKQARVAVRLNPAARSVALNCGSPKLRLKTTVRSGKKSSKSRTVKRLKGQKSRCSVPRDVDLSEAASCDFIDADGNACLAPFPNDYFTRSDDSSETGRRVNLAADSTPVSTAFKNNIDVTELNQSDGFSPGQSITVRIPGMDNQAAFDTTGIVPEGEMSRAYDQNQPALLINAETGERQLIWGELDSNATQDKFRNLIIRPGKNLENGQRYIVALRNLKESAGKTISPPAGFRVYRDNDRTNNKTIEARRANYESIFKTLAAEGVKRSSLYLAWDFTVASTENLTGRMLSIRDRAFGLLGDNNLADGVVQGASPEFTITDAIDDPPGRPNVARQVDGTFEVPCYLNEAGCPTGSTFDLDADQKPIRIPGNTFTARFRCNIPKSSIAGGEVVQTARPSLYGHGLFNEFYEASSGNVRELGDENSVLVCATDWIGMSASDDQNPFHDDIPTAIAALQDLSKFPAIPDRLQQGFLNFLYLGRLLIHEDGFTDDPAFKFNGVSVIDTEEVFYYGNSQGGIAGGALTAISPDVTRSVLYVPGINYSTLLQRSSDFTSYAAVLYPSYNQEIERPLIFSLMQMLWDRGEPNGYANQMTDDELPNTPEHKVMLVMAWGDHEVANVTTEVEARTIGAPLRAPTLDANRLAAGAVDPFYGHEILGDLNGPAADGNAFFVWDTGPKRTNPPGNPPSKTIWGTDPAPLANTAPNNSFGQNPHDTVIEESPLARKQIADFIDTNGKVTNPCGPNPCYAAGWNGFP